MRLRVRTIRERQGRSLTHLAEVAGVSKGYLSSIETDAGAANPTLDVLVRIAWALDVSLAELFPTTRTKRPG